MIWNQELIGDSGWDGDFHFGHINPISEIELADLIADVDERLIDPIKDRPYFSGYNTLAKQFIERENVLFARHVTGVLAGCAVIYADPELFSQAFETYIGIRKSFEGQGIGYKLTNMEFELCRQKGMKKIMTNCHPDNIRKIKLNLQNGYSVVTDQHQIQDYLAFNPKWAGKAFFIREI
jgi:GNAT superfamily N-acetyltransferase